MLSDYFSEINDHGTVVPVKDLAAFPRSEQAVLGAKNLLPNNAQSQTVSNVTYTVNSDGNVSCANTSNAVSWLPIWRGKLKRGTYIISGCPAGGGASGSTYRIGFWNETPSAGSLIDVRETGDGKIVTIDDDTQDYAVYVGCGSNTNMDGITFKPMLRLATDTDSTYVPYAMTNKELTEKVEPIPFLDMSKTVYVSGTYTDLNDVKTSGIYSVFNSALNKPSDISAMSNATLIVTHNGAVNTVTQTLINGKEHSMYVRFFEDNVWTSWYKFTGTVVS